MDYFTLNAPPNTHLWRKPASKDIITAPIIYTCPRNPFIVAEVTITADWEMEWDQGGLVLFAGAFPGDLEHPTRSTRSRHYPGEPLIQGKWVKAGVEFANGTLNASSVVATSPSGADWSMSPVSPISLPHEALPVEMSSLHVKLERIGDSLWIWYRLPGLSCYSSRTLHPGAIGAEWRKMREVAGFFWGIEDKGGVWVGCYASRPMRFSPSRSWDTRGDEGGGAELCVEFEDLEIF